MGSVRVQSLHRLAHLYGVQTAYYDVARRRRQASPDALLHILRALGAPLESFQDVPAAIRQRREALWKRYVEPVVVAWEGGPTGFEVRVPSEQVNGSLTCHLLLESGELHTWTCELGRLPTSQAVTIEGVAYFAKTLSLPHRLPWGYHRLTLEAQGRSYETMIISAPPRAYSCPNRAAKVWGVFLPLYGLHSKRSWGGGDFADLDTLISWVAGLGGSVVATLPLLPAFLDNPYDASPYAPASRLFWNEFYIHVGRIPELKRCPEVQNFLESGELERELEQLRSSPLVDYRRQMALKRKVLEPLVRYFFTETTERHADFQHFLKAHPQVEDYARFRAAGERQQSLWPKWSERLRNGDLHEGDFDEAGRQYHLYVQWLADEQIKALSEQARTANAGLYLDLPLGVHPHSYDVWRERDAFALEVSGGAPPDVVFTKGQNWGFPPLHPEAMRKQQYRYYIATLRHQLKYPSFVRIDHVMALHRLFWIPKDQEPHEGIYVRYPAEEFYAILNLESHRHRAEIVGENLGTVPAYVNSSMRRHNIQQMYVVQYELNPKARLVLRPVPRDCVASLNTHDMPPFAAYWQCQDIEDRLHLGLLDSTGARIERKNRRHLQHALTGFLKGKGHLKAKRSSEQALLQASLLYLSASPARVVLVNLEDLWLEKQPQNVPGTVAEYPNWQRKARHSFERFCERPAILGMLQEVKGLRKDDKSSRRTNFKNRKK